MLKCYYQNAGPRQVVYGCCWTRLIFVVAGSNTAPQVVWWLPGWITAVHWHGVMTPYEQLVLYNSELSAEEPEEPKLMSEEDQGESALQIYLLVVQISPLEATLPVPTMETLLLPPNSCQVYSPQEFLVINEIQPCIFLCLFLHFLGLYLLSKVHSFQIFYTSLSF